MTGYCEVCKHLADYEDLDKGCTMLLDVDGQPVGRGEDYVRTCKCHHIRDSRLAAGVPNIDGQVSESERLLQEMRDQVAREQKLLEGMESTHQTLVELQASLKKLEVGSVKKTDSLGLQSSMVGYSGRFYSRIHKGYRKYSVSGWIPSGAEDYRFRFRLIDDQGEVFEEGPLQISGVINRETAQRLCRRHVELYCSQDIKEDY